MSLDVSRRGLLGLIAAAPVAAVAKPVAATFEPLMMTFAGIDISSFEPVMMSYAPIDPVPPSLRELTSLKSLVPEILPPDVPVIGSDAAAGIEGRGSPSDLFFAPAAASGADENLILKFARAS